MERSKRRALNSTIMKELENEISGAPEEISDRYANTLEVETQEERHRIKLVILFYLEVYKRNNLSHIYFSYEEENFVRMPLTKTTMVLLHLSLNLINFNIKIEKKPKYRQEPSVYSEVRI